MKNKVRFTSLFIGLIVLGLMFSSPGYTVDSDSVVLAWLFDEGSGDVAVDSSGNGNDGELMNGPTWGAGEFGGGLELDGSDDHIVSSTANSVSATFMSETLWVKFTNFDAENQFGYIKGSDTGSDRYFYFSTWVNGGPPHDCIHLGTLDTAGNWGRGIGTGKIFDAGQWYHVAGVIDNAAGVTKAYVDGELAHEQSFDAGDTPGTPIEIWVGSTPGGGNRVNGSIDEVAFFNVALTEADINSIMNDGLGSVVTAVDRLSKLTTTWGSIKRAD